MASQFAAEVRARLRALLARHDQKPGSTQIAETLGRPRSFLHARLREPPVYPTTLEEVDEVLDALGESEGEILRTQRKQTKTTRTT
jgi:hypothetical protein